MGQMLATTRIGERTGREDAVKRDVATSGGLNAEASSSNE